MIKAIKVTSERLTVELLDGRRVSLPLLLFPTLAEAAPTEQAKWELCGAGTGVHWPLLDYDRSAEGLLRCLLQSVEAAAGRNGVRDRVLRVNDGGHVRNDRP